jgi:hypothetical protein
MRTLCALVYQLGADYAIFIPMVSKVLAKRHIQVPCAYHMQRAPTCTIVLPAGALLCNPALSEASARSRRSTLVVSVARDLCTHEHSPDQISNKECVLCRSGRGTTSLCLRC